MRGNAFKSGGAEMSWRRTHGMRAARRQDCGTFGDRPASVPQGGLRARLNSDENGLVWGEQIGALAGAAALPPDDGVQRVVAVRSDGVQVEQRDHMRVL